MLKEKLKITQRKNALPAKTIHLFKRMCSKEAASKDMTREGFVNDSKGYPVTLLIRPLKQQLDKLWGNSHHINANHFKPSNKRVQSEITNGKKCIKKSLERQRRKLSVQKPTKSTMTLNPKNKKLNASFNKVKS